MATVLVQEGTLGVGEPFITGVHSGRVRALLDEHGQRVEEAKPSVPVQVLGLAGVPQAGDIFAVANSEREAKDLSQRRQLIKREQDHRKLRTVTLSDLHDQIQQGHIQELRVVVKGDVDGSVEAIAEELGRITHEEVRVNVIHSAVGAISESDVLLAAASSAILLGFHVNTQPSARDLAVQEGVEIRNYRIIYEVIEDVRAALAAFWLQRPKNRWWAGRNPPESLPRPAWGRLVVVWCKTAPSPAVTRCGFCAMAKLSLPESLLRCGDSRTT